MERNHPLAVPNRRLAETGDAWLAPPDAAPPTQMQTLHRKLDAAASAAYGWPDTLADAEILERLLALNGERAS